MIDQDLKKYEQIKIQNETHELGSEILTCDLSFNYGICSIQIFEHVNGSKMAGVGLDIFELKDFIQILAAMATQIEQLANRKYRETDKHQLS